MNILTISAILSLLIIAVMMIGRAVRWSRTRFWAVVASWAAANARASKERKDAFSEAWGDAWVALDLEV